jgi:hypothetical protein
MEAALPPAKVELPPVPPAEAFEVVARYPDGAWSVSGLQADGKAKFGTSVTVRGRLVDVYRCPPAAEGSAAGAGCQRPNFTLVDERRRDARLLVTGYPDSTVDTNLRAGELYDVEGTYSAQARGFTASEQGLVVALRVSGPGLEGSGATR